MSWESRVEEDPIQPDLSAAPPQQINKTASRNGILYVAGEGNKKARVMIISSALLSEEAKDTAMSVTGASIASRPRFLKGATGATLRDAFNSAGIDLYKDTYYTAVCKWLLPKANRTKPTKEQINWGLPALEQEIKTINPDIIICLGKTAFDVITGIKIALKDGRGGWFKSERFGCSRVYLMDEVTKPTSKPEYVPLFYNDALQIRRMMDEVEGIPIKTVEQDYRVIDHIDDLKAWVVAMKEEKRTIFSVDCEWGGTNHVDGDLRSVQFCWAPGKVIYIKFRDENQQYVFDGAAYSEVGAVLSPLLDSPEVKYVGHHIAADLPWLHVWLGLDWYEKTLIDTEFAQQCIDEYAELSLESLALKYTDLGRYDLELTLWKKKNKVLAGDGYAKIPDDIIIPYACKDVDTVMRSYPVLWKNISHQKLTSYYVNILNPFVTDVFTCFALLGLPMDVTLMDELRELYTYCRDALNKKLQDDIYEESKAIMAQSMVSASDDSNLSSDSARATVERACAILGAGDPPEDAWRIIKDCLQLPSQILVAKTAFDHMVEARHFNIRSTAHMRRWLFEVKNFQPVKSTANREKGLPSLPWEKVLNIPEKFRRNYQPSVDKQSLEILSEKYDYDLLHKLLRLNAIGNICKAFLKEPDVDEEGNVTKENGLHFFLCSDGRVHGQMSTTETGRPRSWKPNSLNWPKYVGNNITRGMREVLLDAAKANSLPKHFRKYLVQPIPSLRSCVAAEPGWCFVESDYQTAEVRGLAYISGDDNLIRIISEPDKQFAIDKETGYPKRISYDEYCGIPVSAQDQSLLVDASDGSLLRGDDGNLVHPPADLHWSLAEMMYGVPREKLNKDIHRAAAKVGNFQSMYGASSATLERKIEQDTGKKPDFGTGARILAALEKRQPVATAFLKEMEIKPKSPGYLRAASGRLRHFATHQLMRAHASSDYAEEKLIKSLGREARNFFMQESVAATSARASKWLLDHFLKHNMQARPMVVLYDSVVTYCPLEERHEVARLHQSYMTDKNTWNYFGAIMNYPIDNEFVMRWSTELTAKEKEVLYKQ